VPCFLSGTAPACCAVQVRGAYRQLVAEVASSAEHSQSGRPLNPRVVAELQEQEQQVGGL
jgi:hypothetical protein